METSDLIQPAFWESGDCRVLAPSGLEEEGARLGQRLAGEEAVIFATSGSCGLPKWVLFRRAALLDSAEAVNGHLQVTSDDRLLVPLPLYHVGGFGMAARSHVAGCFLRRFPGTWSAPGFTEELDKYECTLTSLVPTQVHDLVSCQLEAPSSLRAVVVGGAGMDEERGQAARDLGWPLLQSYGMTEAGSQVATDVLGNLNEAFQAAPLSILSGWECRVGENGCLQLRGEALFECYLRWENDEVRRNEARGEGGWFESSDLVDLSERGLTMRGRTDRRVKILGELVDVQALEEALRGHLTEYEVHVLPLPDERRGWRLLPVVEGSAAGAGEVIENLNKQVEGYARLEGVCAVGRFPRTALGKIDVAALREEIGLRQE